jgi:hypothetical protein
LVFNKAGKHLSHKNLPLGIPSTHTYIPSMYVDHE